MIIDTHLHIVDQSALSYPWLAGAGALNRDALYEEYAREARRLGISAALHMEVDVAESDIEPETDYVDGVAARAGSLLVGAIAAWKTPIFRPILSGCGRGRSSRASGAFCMSCPTTCLNRRCFATISSDWPEPG